MCIKQQEAESRMWSYVYPKYTDALKADDERWKEERDRKVKEERSRSKEASKEDSKEAINIDVKGPQQTEDPRGLPKDPRTSTHVPVSSPLTQHQSYIPYMHGYTYSQAYDPSHPSYRGMPAVMMQNYPGILIKLLCIPRKKQSFYSSDCSVCSIISITKPCFKELKYIPVLPSSFISFRFISPLQLFILPVWQQGCWQ